MSDTLAHASAGRYVGQAVLRKEDPRLLTGRGRYNDDITLPGMLHAHFVRSDVARAKIHVDVSAAREADGVVAVFTGPDLNDKVAGLLWELRPPQMLALLERRLAEGKLPLCAEMCSTKSLLAGDGEIIAQIYKDRVSKRGYGSGAWGWKTAYRETIGS